MKQEYHKGMMVSKVQRDESSSTFLGVVILSSFLIGLFQLSKIVDVISLESDPTLMVIPMLRIMFLILLCMIVAMITGDRVSIPINSEKDYQKYVLKDNLTSKERYAKIQEQLDEIKQKLQGAKKK